MSALIECCIALGGTEPPPPSPPQRRPRPQRLATIDYVEDGGHFWGGGASMWGYWGGERPPPRDPPCDLFRPPVLGEELRRVKPPRRSASFFGRVGVRGGGSEDEAAGGGTGNPPA